MNASLDVTWEVAVPARAELGERPFWDPAVDALMWVDILAGHLHEYRPGRGDSVVHTAGVAVGAAGARAGGGYVLAAADGFRLVDASGQASGGPWRPPGMLADVRFNDGVCDPLGRFWAGTVAGDRRAGAGVLYRLDPSGEITVVLDGVTESNGLGWSPDGGTFYYIDSGEPSPRIRAFPCDLAAGTLGVPRDLARPAPSDGIPDGLVVDADGCLWVAFWGGGMVRRYSPSGQPLATLPVPVSQPSCPAFGGPGLGDLYVTTAWEDMSAAAREAEPLAGHVLHTRVDGVAGLPAGRFGG